MSLILSRRSMLAALFVAPAIVRASSLMAIRPLILPPMSKWLVTWGDSMVFSTQYDLTMASIEQPIMGIRGGFEPRFKNLGPIL